MKKFTITCVKWCLAVYEWMLSFILKGRHVHVYREKYMRKLVNRFYGDRPAKDRELLVQCAVEGSPLDILTEKQVKKTYNLTRWHYGTLAFLSSFALTLLPGYIWLIVVACVLDFYFSQCLRLRAMQKTMMLYGRPLDVRHDKSVAVAALLAIDRSGVMVGKHPILQRLKSGMGFISKQVVRRFGPEVVIHASESIFLAWRFQLVKWFSIVMSKEDFHNVFLLSIPIICALISGIVSAINLVPKCNKLRNHLVAEGNASANA